jgi:hypothetical protein
MHRLHLIFSVLLDFTTGYPWHKSAINQIITACYLHAMIRVAEFGKEARKYLCTKLL